MKYVTLLALGLLCSSAFAARSPRLRDEVAKIAVGPDSARTTAGRAPASEPVDTSDAEDSVDKPIQKPVIITTDAPGAHVEAAPAAAAAKPTAPKSVRDEGTISIHGVNDEEPSAEVAPVAKINASKAEPTKDAPVGREEKAEAKHVVDGVTAEQSLKWLENGNIRYTTHKFRADGRGEKERAKKDVKPHAIVLSCSDSRVPPELIFDQGLGEITSVRVAGEVLDSSVIATIEQSIQNEHPHLLVVLGHTQCSAIDAAFNWKDKASFGSDALDRMVSEIKPHFKTLNSPTRSPGLQVEAALQADGVARDLTERSEIIKKAVDSGDLTIKTGLYWVDTGKVKFY